MGFSPNTRGRSWVGTIHIHNMENAGLTKEQYEDPEFLADFMIETWEQSGAGRSAGIAVCLSAEGCYHCHIACYGNTTTLSKVSKVLFQSHIEPQLGGKDALRKYLLKEGEYAEKGEQVLCTKGVDVIKEKTGSRSDLEDLEEMLESGLSPDEIFDSCFRYRRYERMIRAAYLSKRIKEAPVTKDDIRNIWICGESGTGKTYIYKGLCDEYGRDKIYFYSDVNNGGLDYYMEKGAPPILFIDEFKGTMQFSQLLTILGEFADAQIHCRYNNCYCLWETVYITSVFGPEEVYKNMVSIADRNRDSFTQLKRRLTEVWYTYKENDEYKVFKLPASEYESYADLKRRALNEESIDDDLENPFLQKD